MKTAMKKVMKKSAMKKAMRKSAMKAMKKAMKTKVVATGSLAKFLVFRGSRTRTSGGLKKTDLKKNKSGKIVSAKMSAAGKKKLCKYPWLDSSMYQGTCSIESERVRSNQER